MYIYINTNIYIRASTTPKPHAVNPHTRRYIAHVCYSAERCGNHLRHYPAVAIPAPAMRQAAPAAPPNTNSPAPATTPPVMKLPVLMTPPAISPLLRAAAATQELTGRALVATIRITLRAASSRCVHRRFAGAVPPSATAAGTAAWHAKQKASPHAPHAHRSPPPCCSRRQILQTKLPLDTTSPCADVGHNEPMRSSSIGSMYVL